ncbi:hypothetical protein G9A89_006918 [Geosiphon pyriformis]|nr:hypothetical protein G9A89_006918 [Geosiphon pyriformis]
MVRARKTNLLTGLLLKIFGLFEVVETTLELTRVCLFERTLTEEELPAKEEKKFFFLLYFNTSGGPKIFKPLFAGSKSYAKAAAFVVSPGAAAADMNLNLSGPPKTTPPMVSAILFVPKFTVESRLASLESHLSELSVLIKSLVEPIGALVVLVTKLLSTSTTMDVSIKECMNSLAKQNKGLAVVVSVIQKSITHLEKRCEQAGLENGSDVNDIIDDDDDKNFSVYDNTFDVMMHL